MNPKVAMVATTPTANNCPQKDYNDMASSIESGCVENVFFTVRNLYTGKRVLRQVKQEEITKVSFILGQLATQNVVVKELMFLICALIGDIPLSESLFSQDQHATSVSKPISAQELVQDSSPPNNELLSEYHSSEPINSSNSPKEKPLRPRSSQQKGKQTPRSKTRSRKRNIFTEDEEDEDGKERNAITTRSKLSRGSKDSGNVSSQPTNISDSISNDNSEKLQINNLNANSTPTSSQPNTTNGITTSLQSFHQVKSAGQDEGIHPYCGIPTEGKPFISITRDNIDNMDAMMSDQQVYDPIVITSSMIEATDDDYDDPEPPSQISPHPSEIIENNDLSPVTSVQSSLGIRTEQQDEHHSIFQTKQEYHNCELCDYSTPSSNIMKQHKESYHPAVSLVSTTEDKPRISSPLPDESSSHTRKRESKRISDIIKRETTTKKHNDEGCEATKELQITKAPKVKEKDIITVASSAATVSPANFETPRPGAPHYCEICGKHFDGKNRTTSRVAHMAHAHFKDKLLNDLVDKSPPFRCPAPDCSYQTRERDKWSRHYGSVHGWIKKYLKQYFEENQIIPFVETSHTSYANDKTSAISSPNSFLSPSNTSVDESLLMTSNIENQEPPPLKVTGICSEQKVKEKYILKRNPNQSERRKKIKNGRGRSIFKRKKGKLRKALNKSESKRTDQSEVTENEKDDAAESKTEDGRCKYSSGKVDGLEKCIGCGVGYSSNSALKRHYESVHLRIKKAQCPYCPVKMSQRHNLRNHINAIHLNNKRHQCTICQFSCWKKPDFERHTQKHEEGGEIIEDDDKVNDSTKVEEDEITIDHHPIEAVDDSVVTTTKSKSKKGFTSMKRKRNQRKKRSGNNNTEETDVEEKNNGDGTIKQNTHSSFQQPLDSYPTYVIRKRIGCSRSGLQRKKKPKPKIPPKLTVVISKVGGQIVAKQKEDSSVKPETSIKSSNLGRKSLEAQLAESVMKGSTSTAAATGESS